MERKSRNLAGLRIELCIRITLVSFSTVASILLAWFMLGGSQHHAQAASPPTIQEIYTPSSNPWGLAFDNSGNVWLAEPECDPNPVCGSVHTGSIAQYSRQFFTVLNNYTEPAGFSSPVYLAVDSSGNIWFTEPTSNAIGELIPNTSNPANSTWKQWTVPTASAGPFDLTFDWSGNLWFTEITANKIGFFNTSNHTFAETDTPTGNSKPYGITGPDLSTGSIWFTENNSSVAQIGRFTPNSSGSLSGSIKEYHTNSGSSSVTPHDITFDNTGNIWWTEGPDGKIGRLVISQASNGTSNGVTEFTVPCVQTGTPGVCPGMHISGIGVDSTGTVWFDDSLNSRIGSFTLGPNIFNMYTVHGSTTSNAHPHDGLAIDGNNNIWFAEEFANQLGEAIQNGVPNPTPGATSTHALASPTVNPSPTMTPSPTPSPTSTPGPGAAPVNKIWYFAEGRVGKGFKEYLTLDNPSPTIACAVNIQYLYTLDSGGANTRTVAVTVNPASRLTEAVNADLSIQQTQVPAASVSTIVSVNSGATPNCNGIVTERPMYFNALGVNSGDDVAGATHLSSTFYFADVPTGNGYSSYITILNPPSGSSATVTAKYYANGQLVNTQTTTVPAGARGTISPNEIGLPQHVAAIVSSSQPVVVERPDYFSNINGGNAGTVSGAAVVVGASAPASDWLFAEGYTGTNFQENLVIANIDTSANATANVTIKLEYGNGTTKSFNLPVNQQSQIIWNVNINGAGGATPEVSAEVSSTGAKIVVERQMFFNYTFAVNGSQTTANGGSEVNGQLGPASHSAYSFAEGYTNTGYKEWLTLQNPTGGTETITITLVNGYGRSYSMVITAAGNSRTTIDINALVTQHLLQLGDDYRGYEVSMTIQSNNVPFVAERPMYWNTGSGGTRGGSDAIGYVGG